MQILGQRCQRSQHAQRQKGRIGNAAALFSAAVAVTWMVLATSAVRTALADDFALVIGVSDYADPQVSDLAFTAHDAAEVARVLANQAGYEKVLEMRDAVAGEPQREAPTGASVKFRLESLLGQRTRLTRKDRVLIFFSGHGTKSASGELYLCPKDFAPQNAEETGISVAWLRDLLVQCPAASKVLVIDSCHAGNQKFAYADAEPAADLVEGFKRAAAAEDVVTLASCDGAQVSFVSDNLQQSVFTYHVVEGLKGHADRDLDGLVDVDELYSYVHLRVERDARRLFRATQTPVRIIGAGTYGVPVVAEIKPMPLEELLRDMAFRLAYEVTVQQDLRGRTVVPLEFSVSDPNLGTRLDSGALGQYCATRLADHLAKLRDRFNPRRQPAFQVAKQSAAKAAQPGILQSVTPPTAGEPDPFTRELLKQNQLLLAPGMIRTRLGPPMGDHSELVIQCALYSPLSNRPLAKAGGLALINRNEHAMTGWSSRADLPRDPKLPPDLPPGTDTRHPYVERPAQVPVFPVQLGLQIVKETPAKSNRWEVQRIVPGKFVGNRLYVPVSRGDHYEILVGLRGAQPLMMRLLVDGLNTLPQKIDEGQGPVLRAAPRVNIDRARSWVLDPQRSRQFAVRGFVQLTETAGGGQRFLVTDREDSLAARNAYTDNIGVITAAFYQPTDEVAKGANNGALGTTLGGQFVENLAEDHRFRVGREIGFISLYYVDQDAWEKLPVPRVDYFGK